MKQHVTLKQFFLSSFLLLITAIGYSQVLDSSYRYQLELVQSGGWGGNPTRHTLRLAAKIDSNNTAGFVDPRTADSMCYAFTGDFGPVISKNILNGVSSSTGKIDLSLLGFDINNSRSNILFPNLCNFSTGFFGQNADIERFRSAHLLPDPRTVQRSNTNYNEFAINHAPGGSSTFREYWRYNNGTRTNPLDFGDVTGLTKTHTNNNIPSSIAGYGYLNFYDSATNSNNSNSPDVSYYFTLSAAANVSIRTANPGTNFATRLVLLKKFSTNVEGVLTLGLSSNGNGNRANISRYLCAGLYRIVVEGMTSNDVGMFELSVNATALTTGQINPLIENGHAIPNPQQLFPDFVTGINPVINYLDIDPSFVPLVEDAWQKNEGNGWQDIIPNNRSQSYTLPVLTQNTQYRRRNRGCNNTALYSNTALIRVVNPNGVITGKVRSKSNIGPGVKGIAITIKLKDTIAGSPAGFSYNTITDDDGNYSVPYIYYGRTDSAASADFFVIPFKLNHKFDKDTITKKLLNISTLAGGVDFIDSTVYSISGKVVQECTTCADANGNLQSQTCPLDGVTLSCTNVTGVIPVLSGYSAGFAEYGRYALSVENPGSYNITASYPNHSFTPPIQNVVVVTENKFNLNFKDVTTRVISGKLTAGCNNFIGRAVLEFTDVLPNDSLGNPRTSCFRKRVTTDTLTGNYSITLPARKYKVTVVGFSPTSDVTQQNVIAFFAPAKFERDITERDTTINFVYQRPPVLEVLGLNNDCPGLSGNTIDSAFVVIPQSFTREFYVNVYQGPKPINGTGCPAADTNLRIITNVQNNDIVETFNRRTVNGVDTIRLKGGIPNTIYPFFKTLTIFYTDVFGRQVQFNKNIVVTGVKSDTGTFTTVSPQIPLMVLHDPPGDNSFSFWEKSKSVETAMRFYSADNVGGNLWTEVKLGTKVQLGLGVSTETSVWGSLNTQLGVTARNANTTEAIVTTTTTENFSTSNNPAVTGANGDVFIGTALNLKYARADEIKYTAPCNLSKVGRMMIANDGFGTRFIYSEGHIKNNIIPTLTEFRDNPGNTAAQIANWQNQINVWQQMLANNDANKRRAIWKENYSFDGNVGAYTNITDTFSTKSSTIEFAMEIDKTIAGELGFEIGGSGLSGGVMVNFKIEEGNSTTNTVTKKTTLGYTLDDDDDEGDYFSVTIKTDPVYNSPVFEMEAGTSSCPHEAGTQPRDDMQLAATKPILTGVNGDTAYFTLQLTNTSQSRETRTYLFSFVQQSNTNATVTIGGSPALPVPIPYTISYGGTVSIDVGVKRNGNVFAYEGLQFLATDECGGGISKTAAISAFFTTACSSIQLASPENNWTNTTFNNNIIPVLIKGYTVANLTTVSLEYSKAGISNWIEGFSRTAAQLVNGVNGTLVNWNVAALPDGIYNLRLKLTCASGIVYTERVTGIIDRKGPSLLGITQPTDDNYVNGDIIAADYNENIDCGSLTNFNVELRRMSNNQLIEARLGCYQNNIVVVPLTPITSYVGDSMEVTLKSISDLYGNIKPTSDTWRFIVGSSVPDISNRALKLVNNKASVAENSGDSIVYTFKLPVNTSKDIRVNYSISGNSAPAIDYNVVYGQTPTFATTYTGSQGSIIIKAGTNSSTLKVKPIPNTQFAPDKTITLSLAEGGDYLLSDSTIATGTILNDDTPGTYTFTGNGNFTEIANWQNGLVPPYNTLISDEIIIDPAGNGECIVNVPVRMRAGGKFTVAPGKKLIINGNVRVAN